MLIIWMDGWMDGWIEQEDMKIAQEEIFGPVMSLMKFRYAHHTR